MHGARRCEHLFIKGGGINLVNLGPVSPHGAVLRSRGTKAHGVEGDRRDPGGRVRMAIAALDDHVVARSPISSGEQN